MRRNQNPDPVRVIQQYTERAALALWAPTLNRADRGPVRQRLSRMGRIR